MGKDNSGKSSCSCIKLLIFVIVLLGGAAGALIGFAGIDEIKSWFGITSDSEESGSGGGEGDGSGGGGGDGSGGGGGDGGGGNVIPVDPNACNGLVSNCDMKVNELLFASVHNAHHHEPQFNNNELPLEDALDAGYRSLMLDVCNCPDNGGIIFCHGQCSLGVRNIEEVFTNIGTFLDANPKEVLMINFELSDAGDSVPSPQDLWGEVPDNGIKSKTYNHDGAEWPTLQNLLDDGKRLIMFKHNGVTCEQGVAGCVNKIKEFHDYAVETKYSFIGVDELDDINNSCPGDRGTGGGKDFYAINSFVATELFGYAVPSKALSEEVNEKEYLLKRLQDCEGVTGFVPNIVNVDFWSTGDVLEVVNEVNQARAPQN
jgi:hypothetical protein